MSENKPTFKYFFLAIIGIILGIVMLKNLTPNAPEASAQGVKLMVGTYTPIPPQSDTDSQGIYQITLNPETRELNGLQLAATALNPSFAARAANGHIYSVFEAESGTLSAYNWEEDSQTLRPFNSIPSFGASPCYLALSPDEQYLAVANYMSGNATVYRIKPENGALEFNTKQTVSNTGSGPRADRQEAAHAHWVSWNPAGDRLYLVDLGIDKVMMYPFDQATGNLGAGVQAFATEPGAGPRHMVFHPQAPIAYLLNELNNTVAQLRVEDDGKLTAVQTLSTLPEGFEGHNQGAHIAISADAKTLYASNRGHNSIAVISLAPSGEMSLTQIEPSGGNWPRFFLLLDEYKVMLVANEQSNNISVLEVNEDGTLQNTGEGIFAPSPTFLGKI